MDQTLSQLVQRNLNFEIVDLKFLENHSFVDCKPNSRSETSLAQLINDKNRYHCKKLIKFCSGNKFGYSLHFLRLLREILCKSCSWFNGY